MIFFFAILCGKRSKWLDFGSNQDSLPLWNRDKLTFAGGLLSPGASRYYFFFKRCSFTLMIKDGASMTAADMPIEMKSGKKTKQLSRYNQLYIEFDKPAGENDTGLGFKISYGIYG